MKNKYDSPTSAVIKSLMLNEGLTEAELARRVDLPQPTVHRILSGQTASPRGKSLQAIANYFKVSINELLTSRDPASVVNSPRPHKIRLLDWSNGCLDNQESALAIGTIFTDMNVSDSAFALHMNDASMELQFQQGTLLIFDPQRKPTDRCFVLAYLKKEKTYCFRQLVCSASERYLKALSQDLLNMPLRRLEGGDKIIGVLVQARMEY
jgi:transcriptional regulator with XRE-family HTH domain